MKQVMNSSVRKDFHKQKIAVLRLEMDYELAVLYEAIQQKNELLKSKAEKKLLKIRDELVKLNAF
ncbi:hypothetical protein WAK64_02900 [Bacillus spongiae]|uniref:Uncharacterized protein n=1 Tax=Bacillus spongiae TaxID=2683610 RepID=A0ABU8H9Q7_9BACI